MMNSDGQAAIEYALALFFMVVLLIGVPDMVLGGLASHFQEIVSLLALPIP